MRRLLIAGMLVAGLAVATAQSPTASHTSQIKSDTGETPVPPEKEKKSLQAGGPAVVYRPQIPLGLDLYMPVPEENPLTPEKVALGRRLFFDPILSRDYTLSCSSCHDPRRVFADGLTVAVGVAGRRGTRNAPALLNRVYGAAQFLDGRAASLEEQALQPIENQKEFDMSVAEVVARLQEHHDYPAQFQAAFGPRTVPKLREVRGGREVSAEDLARALASYVRTILAGDAPIDRYMNGEREALTEEARRGLKVFRGKGNCTACHLGPTFTDEQFHNTGVAWRDEELLDPGRFAVTGKEEDRGAFKTPTLREVARTAPYMHDGSLATLAAVVEFYNRGGNRNPYLDAELRPLGLTAEEQQALVAFLRALSGTLREGMATSGRRPRLRPVGFVGAGQRPVKGQRRRSGPAKRGSSKLSGVR